MKINYNIIWVDDKIENNPFRRLRDRIKLFLTEQFFDVDIEVAEDFEEFKAIFVPRKEYDLIITDLNLNDSKGSEIINYIRKDKNLLTEVFFYSANADVSNVDLVNSSRISFFRLDDHNLYTELQKKLEEVISLTIAKFEHIVSMRGMIMHETSTLDLKMESIVRGFINDPKNEVRINAIIDPMIENIRLFTKEKNDKALNGKIKIILKDNVLFNASQKIFALGQILHLLEEEDFSEEYNLEVNLIRNQFAHSELLIAEDGSNFFRVKGVDLKYDSELCKTIRKNIIKHEKNIIRLEEKVNSQ